MSFVRDIHESPIANKNGYGILSERVEVHTYDTSELALLDAHGTNTDGDTNTVEFWLYEAEVRALRDSLNKILGE